MAQQKPVTRLAPALLILLVTAFGACRSSAPVIDIERFHKADRAQASAHPDADAVMLLNRFQVEMGFSSVKNRPYAQVVQLQRIQILKATGLKYAKQTVAFDNYSRILNLQARVYKENGNIIEMDSSHYRDVPFFAEKDPAYLIYPQEGLRVFKVPEVEVGDVIEVATLRAYRDARWLLPFEVDGRLPTVRSEVVLDAPIDFDLDFRVVKGGRVLSQVPQNFPNRWTNSQGQEIKGRRRSLLMENLPPIFVEEHQPPLNFLRTQVFVSLRNYTFMGKNYRGFWSFEDVEKWFFTLTQSQQREDPRLTEAVQKHLGPGKSKREVLRFVQRFLQDRVRDVPSYSHLGVLQGRTPWDVWRFQVGDSKDQAVLGQQMLRAMGYQSLLVLVADDKSSGQLSDMPSPAPFNHVLIAIPEGGSYTFIDPEGRALPLGQLSAAVQGRPGLLLGISPVAFIALPRDEASVNSQKITFDLQLQPTGHARGTLRMELTGFRAADLRAALSDATTNWETTLAKWLWPNPSRSVALEDVQLMNLADPEKPLSVSAKVGEFLLAAPDGDGLRMRRSPLHDRPWPWTWRQKRQTPVELGYPMTVEVKTAISLPTNWGVAAVPEDWAQSSFVLRAGEKWHLASGKLEHQLHWEQSSVNVAPARYPEAIIPATVLEHRLKSDVSLRLGGERGQNYEGAPF